MSVYVEQFYFIAPWSNDSQIGPQVRMSSMKLMSTFKFIYALTTFAAEYMFVCSFYQLELSSADNFSRNLSQLKLVIPMKKMYESLKCTL